MLSCPPPPLTRVTILKSITHVCSKQVYVQGIDCETNTLKKSVNMFERMEIAEKKLKVL